jgi:hypothetical protein
MEAMMKIETTIPAELLDLKARLDQWRAKRKYLREPLPDDLRREVIGASRKYPGLLLRRILKIDPWRLNKSMAKKPSPVAKRKKQATAFFKLPTDAVLPAPISAAPVGSDCRLQIERPDGARLTLTFPALDFVSITRLATDFLRGDKQ